MLDVSAKADLTRLGMPTNHSSQPSRSRLVCLFLIFITLATFWQVRNFEFITCDDPVYVYANPHIRHGLTWEGIKWAFSADLFTDFSHSDYWQPVTWLSRMIDIQLFGLNPSMHHLMNLAFHVLNTLLLFHVLQWMTTATAGGWQRGGRGIRVDRNMGKA